MEEYLKNVEDYLVKFVDGTLAIDLEGTTEDDWRDLVKDFSRINFDLNKFARKWWDRNKLHMLRDETQPFVEYERQNSDGEHLKYPYLILRYDHICGVMSKDFTETPEVISYRVLKDMEEIKTLNFELNF